MGLKQHTAEAALCCQEKELSSDGDAREDRRTGGCTLGVSTRGEWKSSELAMVTGRCEIT